MTKAVSPWGRTGRVLQLTLVFLRMPLAFAMGIVGFYYLTGNVNAAEAMAAGIGAMGAFLIALVSGLNVAPFVVILVIIAIYVVLGCVFESMSMMLLTVPVLFPVVAGTIRALLVLVLVLPGIVLFLPTCFTRQVQWI